MLSGRHPVLPKCCAALGGEGQGAVGLLCVGRPRGQQSARWAGGGAELYSLDVLYTVSQGIRVGLSLKDAFQNLV